MRSQTKSGVLASLAAATIASSALAQDPEISVTPSNPAQLGQPFQVVVKGTPGDIPAILFATELNTTPTPWGDLAITPDLSFSYFLPRIGQDGTSSFQCNTPVCDYTLAQQVYYGQAITFSSVGPLVARGISDLAVLEFVTGDDCPPCALDAETDDEIWSGTPHSEAFWLQRCDEKRWSWVSNGTFSEYTDGTARLVGTIESNSNSNDMFKVDITFSGRIGPSDGAAYPPAESPKLSGILDSALAENGGPIDPSEWHYYADLSGTLTGMGPNMAGTNYDVVRRGPAAQVGFGGSLKNEEYGLSTWLDLTRTSGSECKSSMIGDINIILVRDCP